MNIFLFVIISLCLFAFYMFSILLINIYKNKPEDAERKARGIFLSFQAVLIFCFLLSNRYLLSSYVGFILPVLFFISGIYYFFQNNRRNDNLYLGAIWVVGFILILLVGLADYQSAKRKLDKIRMENQIKEKKTE